jgi:putative nucleotidyltransferase with HDIG domain
MAQTVASISAIHEFRDAYTHGHQNRVAEIACRISDELGLPRFDRDSLELAGHVHDIGKMVVPIEFLTKPTPLTESEMGVIRSHAQIGYDVLSRIDFPWPISRLTYEHHERLDGSGYPNGLVASDLNLGSRILAVADVIDAMTSHRPYRLAADISVALEELVRNGGRLYDREVVAVCLDLYGKNDSSLARPAPGIPETNREKYGATSG